MIQFFLTPEFFKEIYKFQISKYEVHQSSLNDEGSQSKIGHSNWTLLQIFVLNVNDTNMKNMKSLLRK
jgi:hypothetical protein